MSGQQQAGAARIALFIDIENLIGGAGAIGVPIDIGPVIDHLTEAGRILIRRSFGDIAKCLASIERKHMIDPTRLMLHRNLVQIEDVPYATPNKNTCDVRLVVEALSIAYTNPGITHFAVVASDRDYVPLYNKLHELGKTVLTVAIDRENTNRMVRGASDRVIYYENLFATAPAPAPEAREEPAEVDEALAREYSRVIQQAIRAHEREDRQALGSSVASMARQLRSDFDPGNAGLPSFKALARWAQEQSHLVMDEGDGAGDFALAIGPESLLEELLPVAPAAKGPSGRDMRNEARACRRFIEEKLRVPLPSHAERLEIYEAADREYQKLIAGGPFNLEEWKDAVVTGLRFVQDLRLDQRVVFKILLSLHYARAFNCDMSPMRDRNNPVIVGRRIPPEDWEEVVVLNFLKQMQLTTELRNPDPAIMVRVFYPENEEAGREVIDRLLRRLNEA